jgi:hypothetical protein
MLNATSIKLERLPQAFSGVMSCQDVYGNEQERANFVQYAA